MFSYENDDIKIIDDVANICRGASPRPIAKYVTDDENGVNWIKIGDVTDEDIYITQTAEKITEEGAKKSRAVEPGDFILSNSMSFGRPYIVGIQGCVHDGWLIISDYQDYLDPLFFYYELRSDLVQRQFDGSANGSCVKNLNSDLVKKVKIHVPSMDKQKEFIEFAEQSDKSKFACLKSQFIEVFGDPVENPHGWLTKGLMELGSCKNGMNFGAKDIGVTIKSVGVGDIKDYDNIEDIESLTTISLNEMPSEEYMLKDGDLVFVRSNGNKELVGRCVAVYPHETPVSFSGFCIRFRKESSDVLLDYLLRYLKMPEVRAKMAGRGANIQNLNQKILAALQVPVPPLETQMAYVAFVRQSDKSKLCFHLYTTTLHYSHS